MTAIECFAALGRLTRAIPKDAADILEERFVTSYRKSINSTLSSIRSSLSQNPDWGKLYAQLDINPKPLAEGLLLSTLAGMYSERVDRDEPDFADDDPTRLPFDKAITYFRQKLNISAQTWKDIQGAENDWAFAVAGVTNAEMLADIRTALDRYIADGSGLDQFRQDFDAIAQNYGWQGNTSRKADLIATTNYRMAYAAGQWEQRQDPMVRRLRPGLMWRHRDSRHPRPYHLALDGMVFDGNSDEYSGLSAPSGFGCRCRLYSVPAPDGGFDELSDSLPYQFPDGSRGKVPAVSVDGQLYAIADPGFFYTPGASPKSARPYLFQQMLQRQSPTWQKIIRKAIPAKIARQLTPKGFKNAN